MTLILDLPDYKVAALKAKAAAQGLSIEAWLENLAQDETATPGESTGPAEQTTRKRRRISERIAEIMSDVPAEEFAKLPRDGARQIDHYVYGPPKKN